MPSALQPGQPIIGKTPVEFIGRGGGGPLPEQRISQRFDSERGNAVEIVATRIVPAARKLIETPGANAIQRAFDATPELHGGQPVTTRSGRHGGVVDGATPSTNDGRGFARNFSGERRGDAFGHLLSRKERVIGIVVLPLAISARELDIPCLQPLRESRPRSPLAHGRTPRTHRACRSGCGRRSDHRRSTCRP